MLGIHIVYLLLKLKTGDDTSLQTFQHPKGELWLIVMNPNQVRKL